MTKIIERNTTIPARRTEVFSTAEDNQPAVDVVVLQGERERAATTGCSAGSGSTNIRPAPRGEPQIEVTFDIDANGILNVTARDKDTGAEQGITISESSNLDQPRSSAWSPTPSATAPRTSGCASWSTRATSSTRAAYQVERRLAELGDAVPVHEKARAEMLVADARQAVEGRGAAGPGPSLTARAAAGLPQPQRRARSAATVHAGAVGSGQAARATTT